MDKVGWIYVHYGENEYASNVPCEEVAKEYAYRQELREQWPLVVETIEHAGWWMRYHFDEDHPEGLCIGTANDGWKPDNERRRLMEQIGMSQIVHIPPIRRPPRSAD